MEKHGVKDVIFLGFMADNAQANFNAICKAFESKDKFKPMPGKKKTCQFHWSHIGIQNN